MVRKGKRNRRKIDYAAIDKGLQCVSEGDGDERPESGSEPNASLTTSPRAASSISSRSSRNDGSEIDRDIERLRAEKQQLESVKQLQKVRIRQRLRHEVEAMKSASNIDEDAADSPAVPYAAQRRPQNRNDALPGNAVKGDITIKELRNFSKLADDVDAQLTRYGLNYEDDDNDAPLNAQTPRVSANHGKNDAFQYPNKNNVVSGRDARIRDSVNKTLVWPHTKLEYMYGATDIIYGNLDPALLVAGELSVILSSQRDGAIGRLKLLRRLMYHSKQYTWPAARNFHEAVLLEVERGVRDWSNLDYRDIEATTLFQNPQQPRTNNYKGSSSTSYQQAQPMRAPRRYFCIEYNKGRCHQQSHHEAQIGATQQTVENFCATCWRRSRQVREHPEISNDCPLRK